MPIPRIAVLTGALRLAALPTCGQTLRLTESWAMLLPLSAGPVPGFEFTVDVAAATTLRAELRISSKADNHTPDRVLEVLEVTLQPGLRQPLPLHSPATLEDARYGFVCLMRNDDVAAHLSEHRVTGILAVCHHGNKAVAKSATQSPPPGIGIDDFEFWTPKRRPGGMNLALRIEPPLTAFHAADLTNGISRPTCRSNAWVAEFGDAQPRVLLSWPAPQTIATVELDFDTDFDHPLESVLMGHPERTIPFCVPEIRVAALHTGPEHGASEGSEVQGKDVACHPDAREVLGEIHNNHQTRRALRFKEPVVTRCLEVTLLAPSPMVPAALFAIRCYGPQI